MTDINPEGFYRCPDPLCVCGPLYTYAGHIEPGGYAEDCPVHGNPKIFHDEVMRLRTELDICERASQRNAHAHMHTHREAKRLRAGIEALTATWERHRDAPEWESPGYYAAYDDCIDDLNDLLNSTEGETGE